LAFDAFVAALGLAFAPFAATFARFAFGFGVGLAARASGLGAGRVSVLALTRLTAVFGEGCRGALGALDVRWVLGALDVRWALGALDVRWVLGALDVRWASVVRRASVVRWALGALAPRGGALVARCALDALEARGCVLTLGEGSGRALRGAYLAFFVGTGAGGGRRDSRKRMPLSMEAVRASLTIWASAFSLVLSAS
jgi:hypothetical protein